MKPGLKRLIFLVAAAQMALALVILVLPATLEALPGNVRYRLPAALQQIGQTPLPPALPTPNADTISITTGDVAIPGLNPTAAPTIAATPTLPPPPPAATDAATATPTPTPMPSPTPTPIPLPAAFRVVGVKNIPQSFNNCGPANLSVVLEFWGDSTTQTQASAYLKPNPNDRNVSPWQISDYVNEFTSLKSTVHSGGTLTLLKQLIAAGMPPVIERGYILEDNTWAGHYLTLYAYDDTLQEFIGMDTNLSPWSDFGRSFAYSDVADSWKAFNYTFYVVYSAEKEPIVRQIIGETLLDDQRMWERARDMAQADIEANVADAYAWFNLGTSWTELGSLTGTGISYQNGAQAFDEARRLGLPPRMLWYQFRPYLAYYKLSRFDEVLALADATLSTSGGQYVEETYYWKGNALASTGDARGAIAAYEAALNVNGNFYYARWALDSLNG